jgi:hypothetical protein
MDWKGWLNGFFSAVIGGGANGITVMVIDPVQFNFGDGLSQLLKVAAIGAIIAGAMFLRASPLPASTYQPPQPKPEVPYDEREGR